MNGTIADLPLFLEVARTRSFVAAARRTQTPPSTMSRAVHRLERALGVRLLERTSRRVALTRVGQELFEQASAPAASLAAALEGASAHHTDPAGLVRVSASLWLGGGRVAAALGDLAAKHPRIRIDLQLTNTVVDLVDGGVDVAVRAGTVADESLIARRLWDVPFAFAASPAFVQRVLRRKRVLTAQQLAELPAIATTGRPYRLRAADGSLVEIAPNERFRVSDPRVALEIARRGLGIVRAPREGAAAAGLALLTCTAGALEAQAVSAVFRSREFLPARVRLVVDWLARS